MLETVLKDVNYSDKEALKSRNHEICMKYGEVRIIARDYRSFLRSTRTEQSDKVLNDFYEYDAKLDDSVNPVLKKIDERLNEIDYVSRVSGQSGRSTNSQTSSARARAKLEAAKARMELSKKEFELKTKQALIQEEKTVRVAKADREEKVIQAELDLLNEQKIFAEAEAENELYETISECDLGSSVGIKEEESHAERTENYVREQLHYVNLNDKNQNVNTEGEQSEIRLNPSAQVYTPAQSADMFKDFGKFLVKKDVMLQRFSKFNDDPTQYVIWKNSFKNVVGELECTPSEEIDLLMKWLGPESSKQAGNLRAANCHDPVIGLVKIWERMEERYGAPEMVEEKLRKKLEAFPRLGNKDSKKLNKQSDVLSEIESVKENDLYANMYGYFDSPMGVNPIIAKLPVHIQNKWSDRGRKFKVSHSVTFPPFTFFVSFIKEMCSLYNDPSFRHDQSTQKGHREEAQQRSGRPLRINANKGEVNNTGRTCPLHKYAQHTLETCREFRKKPIEERRQFLKDNKLCFRCCKFEHRIRDCKVPIKCDECNSLKHTSSLHFDRKPTEKYDKQKDKDKKQESPSARSHDSVNSKCSKLCGDASLCKSCAKILKVNVYHKDNTKFKVKMYVVLDDQRNRTLANSRFFENICSYKEIDYTLSS